MSSMTLPTIEIVEGTAKQQRTAYANATRAALADEKRAAITAGCYLTLAKGTFTADEMDAWKEWAVSVTRKSLKTVDSYIAVAKAFSGSPKGLQNKVQGWTFEALQAYASVDPEDRAAVVATATAEDSDPTPELVRASREIVRDEKLTDSERNEKAAAKLKRDKENAASKTEQLVSDLKPLLKKVKTDSEFAALIVGIEIGRAHRDEKLVSDALKQIRQQREAGTAAVQKAAEKLVATPAS